MNIVFLPEAVREAFESQAWYEARSRGLGKVFAHAIKAALSRIENAPLSFPKVHQEFRQVLVSKFPYSIIYCCSELELTVVSIFHHSRDPDAWLHNLQK